jgi:hypothetical protein
MVVVEQDGENAGVLARRLQFFVVSIADLARRRRPRLRVAVDLDQPELLDRLRLAVLGDFEVGLG